MRVLLLVLCVACGPGGPEPTGTAGGMPSGTTAGTATTPLPPAPWALTFATPPRKVSQDLVRQDLADAALATEDVGAVFWQSQGSVRWAWVDARTGGSLPYRQDAAVEVGFPRVAGQPDRVWAVTAGESGVVTSRWLPGQMGLGTSVLLDDQPARTPDLVPGPTGVWVAWSSGDDLELRRTDRDLGAAVVVPAPVVRSRTLVGAPRLAVGSEVWLAWSEFDLSGSHLVTVKLASLTESGPGPVDTLMTGYHPDEDGRVSIAMDPETGDGVVAWQGTRQPAQASTAWVRGISGTQVHQLGAADAGEPSVAIAGGVAVAAWRQGEQIWLQPLVPTTGEPIGRARQVSTVGGQAASMPSIDLVSLPDGRFRGLISWESKPRLQSGDAGKRVYARTVLLDPEGPLDAPVSDADPEYWVQGLACEEAWLSAQVEVVVEGQTAAGWRVEAAGCDGELAIGPLGAWCSRTLPSRACDALLDRVTGAFLGPPEVQPTGTTSEAGIYTTPAYVEPALEEDEELGACVGAYEDRSWGQVRPGVALGWAWAGNSWVCSRTTALGERTVRISVDAVSRSQGDAPE